MTQLPEGDHEKLREHLVEQRRIAKHVTSEAARLLMLEVVSCSETLSPENGMCDCTRAHFEALKDSLREIDRW